MVLRKVEGRVAVEVCDGEKECVWIKIAIFGVGKRTGYYGVNAEYQIQGVCVGR